MRQIQTSDKLEEVAREVGSQWGTMMRAQYLRDARKVGSWPGTLDQARRLIDDKVAAPLAEEQRELLALLAERGARRAWNDSNRPPISSVHPIADLTDLAEEPWEPVRSRYGA
jgi:hypothetical protein